MYLYRREHTILLNRKRVHKGMKRRNSLPCLLLFFLAQSYRENRFLHVIALHDTVLKNSYLRLFVLCKNFVALNITLTREATLCPKILNAIWTFNQIFNFCCIYFDGDWLYLQLWLWLQLFNQLITHDFFCYCMTLLLWLLLDLWQRFQWLVTVFDLCDSDCCWLCLFMTVTIHYWGTEWLM